MYIDDPEVQEKIRVIRRNMLERIGRARLDRRNPHKYIENMRETAEKQKPRN